MAKKKSACWALAMLLGTVCLLCGCKARPEQTLPTTIPAEQTAPTAVSSEVYEQALAGYPERLGADLPWVRVE